MMKAEKIGYSKDPLSVHYMKEIKKLFDPKGLLNPYKVRHFCGADAILVPAEPLSREPPHRVFATAGPNVPNLFVDSGVERFRLVFS